MRKPEAMMKPGVAALTVGLLLVTATSAASGTKWRQAPSPNSPGSNELLSAAGSSASDVWAVGRVVTDSNPARWRSLVLHWDGSVWSLAMHPHFAGNHFLEGIDTTDPDDAWAVGWRLVPSGGGRTVVEHWDGVRWKVDPSPNPNPNGVNQLLDVKAVPSHPGTLWAVGSYTDPSAGFGDLTLILGRSEGEWGTVPSPNVTADNHLEAVDATGLSDAWAVGWGSTSPFGGTAVPIALHWDGETWGTVTVQEPSQIMLFGVDALAPDDAWAVGHTYTGGPHWIPLVLHWDGATWSRETIPEFPDGGQLRDIVSLSPTDAFAFGFSGEGTFAKTLVLHWDGISWTRQVTPSPNIGPKLYGGTAVDASSLWAVGHRFNGGLFANQTLTLRSLIAP